MFETKLQISFFVSTLRFNLLCIREPDRYYHNFSQKSNRLTNKNPKISERIGLLKDQLFAYVRIFLSCYHDYPPFSLSRKLQEEQKKDKIELQEKKPTQNRFKSFLKRSGKAFFSVFFALLFQVQSSKERSKVAGQRDTNKVFILNHGP